MTSRRFASVAVCVFLLGALVGAQEIRLSSAILRPEDRVAIEKAGTALIAALTAGRTSDALGLFSSHTRKTAGDDRLGEMISRIRESMGPLELHHAELAESQRGTQRSRVLHVYAKAGKDVRWKDFQITIEPDPPFKFDQVLFIADVAEPVYLPNADLPNPDTRRWLDAYIDGLAAKEGLSGSVLVTQGATTVVARTFGHADPAATQPIRADTRFSMASSSKMFTAVLIAKLAEEGRLRYGDRITQHLPPAMVREPWSQVTVDQLLSHRSGIGEYWTQEYADQRPALATLADFLPWLHKVPHTFAPGTSHRYSNSNFILLGLIVEHVTKRSFDEELRRVLTGPLRMASTSLVADTLPASRDAQMLTRDGSAWRRVAAAGRGSSAGGAWTTVEDATIFLRALASGRLVTPATLEAMTTPRNAGALAFPYGYGLEMRTDAGAPSWGHGGIAPGVNAELRYFPTLDVTLVVFSNQDNGAFDDLKKNLIKLITGDR